MPAPLVVKRHRAVLYENVERFAADLITATSQRAAFARKKWLFALVYSHLSKAKEPFQCDKRATFCAAMAWTCRRTGKVMHNMAYFKKHVMLCCMADKTR